MKLLRKSVTHTNKADFSQTNKQTNKADFSQFIVAQTAHSNTHVHFRWRHRTHTHTQSGRGRSEFFLCIFPTLDCPSSRSSGQPLWRLGTKSSDLSVLVRDRQECSVLPHVFLLGFLVEETLNTGRTCKLHIERPRREPT